MQLLTKLESELIKGCGTIVAMETPVKLTGGKGNSLQGHITKYQEIHGCQLGTDYGQCVENAQERSGSTRDYVLAKPNGKHYPTINGEESVFFLESDKEEGKYYLQMQWTQKMLEQYGLVGIVKEYRKDGVKLEGEELEQVLSMIPSYRDTFKKQHENGVNEGEERRYLAPLLENVLWIKQGEKVWDLKKS